MLPRLDQAHGGSRARASSIPRRWRDRQPRTRCPDRGRGVHQRAAPLAAPRRVDGLRRAPAVHAGRRHPPHRLAAVRADATVLRQGVRGRHQHQLHASCWMCRGRWTTRPRRATSPSSSTRKYLAASLTYFSHQQRDRVGLVTFDNDIVDYVPPSAKHLQHHPAHARPPEARRQRRHGAGDAEARREFRGGAA